MSAHTHKMLIGAAGFAVAFYIARRGYISQPIQQYAIDLSTKAVITGVNF